ncbi:MAG: hypothetical protein HY289_09800 [Planctomycetes bacterium]|nr:hypothetical protein [Planctomycetota bacterium]
MPIHDWTRVDEGICHNFTLAWFVEISRHLNTAGLPRTHYSLVESYHSFEIEGVPKELPAQALHLIYAAKQKTITVRRASDDHLVAMLEIVENVTKASVSGIRRFAKKAIRAIDHRIHFLVIDLLPTDPGQPGLHDSIWSEVTPDYSPSPFEKPLILASYAWSEKISAYVEPTAVGLALVDMPLFLDGEHYVPVPLEATYQAAWRGVPQRWKAVLEAP